MKDVLRGFAMAVLLVLSLATIAAVGAANLGVDFTPTTIQDTVVKVSDIDGRGHGSGVVIDAERKLIITNAHVARGAAEMQITGTNGCIENARVLWVAEEDLGIDVALLQFYGCELPAAYIRTEPMKVGEWVTAVGYPMWMGQVTTTGHIVSESVKHEAYPDTFLLSDVLIAPGNSGGGLFDASGSLVGLTAAMVTDTAMSMRGSISVPTGHSLSVPATIFCDLIACD
jgi:S1-C subfamily serine protease